MTKEEWLEDIKDAEKDVADAEEWLMKRKVYLAEMIIRYHNSNSNN